MDRTITAVTIIMRLRAITMLRLRRYIMSRRPRYTTSRRRRHTMYPLSLSVMVAEWLSSGNLIFLTSGIRPSGVVQRVVQCLRSRASPSQYPPEAGDELIGLHKLNVP